MSYFFVLSFFIALSFLIQFFINACISLFFEH